MATRKHRSNPLKIMCILLYGDHDCITWVGNSVSLKNGPMSRLIRVPNSRLREYLQWLSDWGYIRSVNFSYGESTFEVVPPPNLGGAGPDVN